jgi:ATP-binding cassette subfamily C protein
MLPQFSAIQNSYQYILNMLPAFEDVVSLEKLCRENVENLSYKKSPTRLRKEVSFHNVSFSYQEEHFSIIGLNLRIKAGKTTAIAGPSGAGKSTIADMVMGLIRPVIGTVTLDGDSISQSWRNEIGYVAQDTFLFNETVRFNLLLAKPDAEEKDLIETLKLASAYDFISKLPEGLDTIIGDRGVRLSGGEKQRLALARALLRKPALLILDEATSNLDSENEKRIIKAIDDLHGEMTILMIAHRLSTIKNADYIYLLDDGRVKDSGTWNELLKIDNGWFRDTCEAQGIQK